MFSSSSKKQEVGQGLVEYAMLIVLVSIVVIAALTLLGPQISNVFNGISDTLGTVAGDGGGGSVPVVTGIHPQYSEMVNDSCAPGQMPFDEGCYTCPPGYIISVVDHHIVCMQ